MTRVSDPQEPTIVSRIFQIGNIVEQILVQRMRKLAKKEAVFLAVIRTIEEEQTNDQTVTINEDKTKTPYPMQVQAILDKFSVVIPKDLLAGLPPHRELDHRIELTPGAEPPHRFPYRMSP